MLRAHGRERTVSRVRLKTLLLGPAVRNNYKQDREVLSDRVACYLPAMHARTTLLHSLMAGELQGWPHALGQFVENNSSGKGSVSSSLLLPKTEDHIVQTLLEVATSLGSLNLFLMSNLNFS